MEQGHDISVSLAYVQNQIRKMISIIEVEAKLFDAYLKKKVNTESS